MRFGIVFFAVWVASASRTQRPKDLVTYNRDQFLQLLAQLAAEPEQQPFRLRRDKQTFGQPGAKDAVFFLEVGDLMGKILLGDGRQQGQEWMQNAAHCGMVIHG